MNAKNSTTYKSNIFEMLFYTINMLKHLFSVVQKMPFLGRYYKAHNNNTISCFIEIIAAQSQRFYSSFKCHLIEIITYNAHYIKTKDE